jgi:hypothetical protein
MELERLRRAWKEEKFEGYLFHKPVRDLVPGLQKRLQTVRRRTAVQDFMHGLTAVVTVVVLGRFFSETASILARVGLATMMAGMTIIVAEILIHRFRTRGRKADLPMNEFYRDEYDRVTANVRLRRRIWAWSAAFGVIGFGPFFASVNPSMKETVFFLGFLGLMIAYCYRINERRIRRDLLPLKESLAVRIGKLGEDAPGN